MLWRADLCCLDFPCDLSKVDRNLMRISVRTEDSLLRLVSNAGTKIPQKPAVFTLEVEKWYTALRRET